MRQHGRWAALAAVLSMGAAACATNAAAPAPRVPEEEAGEAEVRLLEIDPASGTAVDSSTVITATLAYHIPGFDSTRIYTLSPVFAARDGRMIGRGGGPGASLESPAGIVTVRHRLGVLRASIGDDLSRPLTGSFFLVASPDPEPPEDTVAVGPAMRVRVVNQTGPVIARSRTFFYNGGGPARMLGGRSLLDRLEEYWRLRPHRAMAVAVAPDGRWTYGYAYGFPDADAADERALEECRSAVAQRELPADCRLVADPGR